MVTKLAAVIGFLSDPFLSSLNLRIFRRRGYYLKGYFQTFRNYEACEPQQRELSLVEESAWYVRIKEKIASTNAVAIHVRQGDYVQLSNTFGLLTSNYYHDAISEVNRNILEPTYFIFSDDVSAARKILEGANCEKIHFMNPPENSNPAESLLLMSKCKGLVIANSSFSYWSALLGGVKDLVVYPAPWTISLRMQVPEFPAHWVKIDSQFHGQKAR